MYLSVWWCAPIITSDTVLMFTNHNLWRNISSFIFICFFLISMYLSVWWSAPIITSDTVLSCTDSLCQNGGTCKETEGPSSYVCACPEGFRGQQCGKTSLKLNSAQKYNRFCEKKYAYTNSLRNRLQFL